MFRLLETEAATRTRTPTLTQPYRCTHSYFKTCAFGRSPRTILFLKKKNTIVGLATWSRYSRACSRFWVALRSRSLSAVRVASMLVAFGICPHLCKKLPRMLASVAASTLLR